MNYKTLILAGLGTLGVACGSVQPQIYQAPVRYEVPQPAPRSCAWDENMTNDGYCLTQREAFILNDLIAPLKYGASEVTEEGRVVQKYGFACLMDKRAEKVCAEVRREADENGDKTITYQEAIGLKERVIEYFKPSEPFYFEEEQIMQDGEYSERTTRISEDKVQSAIGEYRKTAEAALSACETVIRDLPDSKCICPVSLENCNYFSGGKKALARDYSKIPEGRRDEVREVHDELEPLLKKAELLLERDLKHKCGYELDCGDLK